MKKYECSIKNPLVRDGTSQAHRLLRALQPDYALVDGRSFADLLCFAYRYAHTLQYYTLNNEPAESWRIFFERDVSMTIALIADKDLEPVKTCAAQIRQHLEHSPRISLQFKGALRTAFDLIATFASEINDWYENAGEGLQLQQELQRMIHARLRQQLIRAIGFYRYATVSTSPLFTASDAIPCEYLLRPFEDILNRSFHPIWVSGTDSTWQEYVKTIALSPEDLEKISTIETQIMLIIETFLNAQAQIIHHAPAHLQETLEKWPHHEPHLALFLAFLRLFQYAQEHLNTLTQRHLDFYYKEVLQFQEQEEVPDRVHVLFELAKQVHSHVLQAGTLLKAGKDANGTDVVYQLDQDMAINKAKVQDLKSVFIDQSDNGRMYEAPIANSQDGLGREFDAVEPKWLAFRESQPSSIGFAIASPTLLLQEGNRDIVLTLSFPNEHSLRGVAKESLQGVFTACLSGEKDWIEKPVALEGADIIENTLTLAINLSENDPPVVGYHAQLPGPILTTKLPVVKIILANRPNQPSNRPNQPYWYDTLSELTLGTIELMVDVRGVKQLIIQNETGVVDANAPFYPFGTTPGIGSTWYIGSAEIFQKTIESLTLWLQWKDVPEEQLGEYYANYFPTVVALNDLTAKEKEGTFRDVQQQYAFESSMGDDFEAWFEKYGEIGVTNASFQANCSILLDKNWKTVKRNAPLFNSTDAKDDQQIVLRNIPESRVESLDEPLTAYTYDTRRGFLKIELAAPEMAFGHRIFRDLYTKRIIQYATGSQSVQEKDIPKEPYTPVIALIKVDYTAKETLEINQHTSLFYQLFPFGFKDVHPEREALRTLLPQFQYKTIRNQGELYIGISGLIPRQKLSLLVQIAEGSADPELPKQPVNWSYLSHNQWQPFTPETLLSDSTNGLLTSGILTFDIPQNATDDNTILPAGQYWLRASVHDNTGAICDLIDVRAQAASASFVNRQNDPLFLAQSFPAQSISKLQIKHSAIKSVNQPYASFGGRIREQSEHLYTRVSERLRHKGRGITIWDYERLALERFPSVYKVKCINHSTYHFQTDTVHISHSEFAPGYVSLIVIPDLRNKNAVDPLEPRASLSTLQAIKTYLSSLISPFAAQRLRVINPFYERIQVNFSVKFHQGCDWGRSKERLNEDLKRFLSPWAFEEGEDIQFGGKIHRSVILNFVEERPYVDFVADFYMKQSINDEEKERIDEALPSTARSILVSDKEHIIKEIT